MSEEFKNLEEEKIRLLKWPEAIRQRYGMYLDAGAAAVNNALREIVDNSLDEVQYGADKIIINRDLGGLSMVWDNGRGIPISFSDEQDEIGNPITQAKLSISTLHSGSKFAEEGKVAITVGQNGVGSASVSALSDDYILLSRITPVNYNKSIPEVEKVWNENIRKKDLFYIVWYKRGILFYEGAGKKSQIEKLIYGKKSDIEIPSNGSTIVLFKLDTSIFTKEELSSMQVNIQNLQYFLLIQEKFYGKKKVSIEVEGNILTGSGFTGYGCDMIKEIIPADTSANPKIGLFISIGYDEELGPKEECGSVNSLTVNSGVHIQYVENAFAKALKENYGIKHRYLITGLKLCVVTLSPEVVFSSQTKEKLKSFTKVKEVDFISLTKDFIKMFKKFPDYWDKYVEKLNFLADSMKSLSAVDKAQKMIDSSTGSSFYKSRSGLVDGFADATAKNRWDCELFLCFTGDTEILTCNDECIKFTDLVKRINSGKSIYTFSCKSDGEIIPSKIIAAKEIKKVSELCKVTLNGGDIVKCTPDHKFMLRNGQYKEAGNLKPGESLMPCYSDYYEVVNVELYEVDQESVYCLEVDSEEHNFPLAAGVFVKNCEGLSPAGSLKAGRKPVNGEMTAAILPLRGKILNVSDATIDKALDNKEISTIFTLMSVGIQERNVTTGCKTPEEAYEKLKRFSRYGKICLAADADSDGQQIISLILYMFSKFARFLIDFGCVYISLSPLFEQDGKYYYPGDPIDTSTGLSIGLNPKKPFRRWKGLGSIPKELIYDAFFNPATRRLIQVTPEGIDYAMSLTEDITVRKNLLYEAGILTNPYNFTDL